MEGGDGVTDKYFAGRQVPGDGLPVEQAENLTFDLRD
jgi:hypothetical protein